jgi:hypothetical protein
MAANSEARGMNHLQSWGVAGLFAAAFAPGATEARAGVPSAPTRAPAMQAVLDCRPITDPGQRLACYDKAVAAVSQAENSGDLVTIDREQRRTVRRQAFGLILPSLAMFDRGEKPEEADHIAVTLARATLGPTGKWTFTLDDGAVWRQIDDGDLEPPPRPGDKAVIRRAALGSFMIKIGGKPSVRVHRDN